MITPIGLLVVALLIAPAPAPAAAGETSPAHEKEFWLGIISTDYAAPEGESAGKLLEGYGAGGGVDVLATGTLSFREGLARNPEDRRLRHIVDFLEADARRQRGN